MKKNCTIIKAVNLMNSDLSKQKLYESVKTLIESNSQHIILKQHKLFTLFSIAFQYLLFCSSKKIGTYIIRIEERALAEKFSIKSKDPSTRKFLKSLLLSRKLKFNKSMFYLDFFNPQTQNITIKIPKEKIQGVLIVKDHNKKLFNDELNISLMENEENTPLQYYPISSLLQISPKSITIGHDLNIENITEINFPFIREKEEKITDGVTLFDNITGI